MFSYFGSKSKIIKYYPLPLHETIVEPFAGSARYSLRYSDRKVILIEKYKKLVDIWSFLINASSKDILTLPDFTGEVIRTGFSPADDLIFLCASRGNALIYNYTKYGKFNSWNKDKIRIASLVPQIKHWKIIHGDYTDSPAINATWFIDPPYQKLGYRYKHHFKDYAPLKNFCENRKGQVIVCENNDADWMSFSPLIQMRGSKHKKLEMMWYKENA